MVKIGHPAPILNLKGHMKEVYSVESNLKNPVNRSQPSASHLTWNRTCFSLPLSTRPFVSGTSQLAKCSRNTRSTEHVATRPLGTQTSNEMIQSDHFLADFPCPTVDWIGGTFLREGNSETVFASAGSDNLLNYFDIRTPNKLVFSIKAHAGEVLCCDFNKYNETILTGSTDNFIHLWDIRNAAKPANSFLGHRYAVRRVKFSPFRQEVFMSAS